MILDSAGAETRGTLGDARPLREGHYRFRATLSDDVHDATLWINTGVETLVRVHPENVHR